MAAGTTLDALDQLKEAVVTDNLSWLSKLLSTSPVEFVNAPVDETDTTLLHLAANASPAVMELLLQHSSTDVSQQNDEGVSPLHVAAMWGNAEAVRLLLDYGADPLITDDDDMTAFDHAMSQPISEDHKKCIEALENAVGLYTTRVESGAGLDMSMAEVYVSMMNDDTLLEPSVLGVGFDTPPASPLSTPVNHTAPVNTHVHPSNRIDIAMSANSTPSTPITVLSHTSDHSAQVSPATTLTPSSIATPPTVSPLTSLVSPMSNLTVTKSSEETTTPTTRNCPLPEDEDCYLGETILLTDEEIGPLLGNGSISSHTDVTAPTSSQAPLSSPPPPKLSSEILSMSNEELRKKLVTLGEQPGPIDNGTRSAYQHYLAKILEGTQPQGNKGYKGYKYELALVLHGTAPIPNLTDLEKQVFKPFRQPATPSTPCATPKKSKFRPTKDHFNYFLLDPTLLDTMNSSHSDLQRFRMFVEAIFYVGKGKNSRSMQHLKDARSCSSDGKSSKLSAKLKKILSMWSQGRGVVSLHLFHNTIAEEAFTREACLIEAIGLDILTNVQRGHVYGEVCGWRMSRRRQLGVYLLNKAFNTYLIDPPQEILQEDL